MINVQPLMEIAEGDYIQLCAKDVRAINERFQKMFDEIQKLKRECATCQSQD